MGACVVWIVYFASISIIVKEQGVELNIIYLLNNIAPWMIWFFSILNSFDPVLHPFG